MAKWHPIMNAAEIQVGVWYLIGPLDRPYAIVSIVEIGGQQGYRAVTYAAERDDRKLIGYYRTLASATFGAHGWFVSTRAPLVAANPGWEGAYPPTATSRERR